MKRIAVLASGRGSNFQALIDAVCEGLIPGRLIALLTDNPDAYAVVRATDAGIPVMVIDYMAYSSRTGYEAALRGAMRRSGADLFVLAGYMRILDPGTVQEFRGRVINIHPALLPSFPGLHAQRQALAHGVKVAGCTVHFVDEETDHGPIILQACVPVLEDDDEDTLAERILLQEHMCLQEAVRLFCEGRLRIEGRLVHTC
ncbi:MAG: phosphoribosylglycinamide formyltransferase [Methanoregulaceae archaeon]|nr:phosphoribosylglycinamide formyltransferase [Methanoregulaceae archaeon]